MIPKIGIFINLAILYAFLTIIETKSCGDVTITIPSTGKDWKAVKGISPVPGGISTNIKSTSPHLTSVQNCFSTFESIEPRHTTGLSGVSSNKFMLIALIPVFVTAGIILSPSLSIPLFKPKILGIDAPVMSPSIIAVL